jgi:hypothetical protein
MVIGCAARVAAQSHECEPNGRFGRRMRPCAEEEWSVERDAAASGVATGPGASFALVHGLDPGDGNGVTFCHEIGI